MTAIPGGPEDLTPAWLSGIVGAVASAEVERIVAFGGVNGEAFRVRLQTAAGPSTLIAKFPADDTAARGVASYQRWYEREVRFYRELAARTPFRVPETLYAEIGPDDRYLLLMEDLGGWRQGDQVAGCSVRDAARAVEQVARMHARWWGRVDGFAWLPRTTVGLERAVPVQGAFARAWQRALRRDLPPGVRSGLGAAVDAYPRLLEEVSASPSTLCHGDFRLDNLFFAEDGEVAAIDWQFACRAHGMYDVAYFVGLDLDPEVRRGAERSLIARYREVLHAGGVEGYGEDQAWRDYRLSLILALAVFVIGAGGEMRDERMRRVHDAGIVRLAKAIEDTGALEAI